MTRKRAEVESWFKAPTEQICPLCERPIPESQKDRHHLVPKLKGGKETTLMHRICHRQLHALFSESELASHYNTVASLMSHPEVAKFVQWVRTKPGDFYVSPRLHGRRR